MDTTYPSLTSHNHLGLSIHGVDPEGYICDIHLAAFRSIAKASYRHHVSDLKNTYLKRKYRLLFYIVVKVIFGERQSTDSLSQMRICSMKAIIDGVECDWASKFLDILRKEKNRFFFTDDTAHADVKFCAIE